MTALTAASGWFGAGRQPAATYGACSGGSCSAVRTYQAPAPVAYAPAAQPAPAPASYYQRGYAAMTYPAPTAQAAAPAPAYRPVAPAYPVAQAPRPVFGYTYGSTCAGGNCYRR